MKRVARPITAKYLQNAAAFYLERYPSTAEGLRRILNRRVAKAKMLDAPIMDNVNAGKSKGGNQFVDVDAALGYQFPDMQSKYDERDLSIYALGIGAAEDPAGKDLRLVYEMHGEGMVAAPSYGVIPALNCILTMGKEGKTAPTSRAMLAEQVHSWKPPSGRNLRIQPSGSRL